MANITPFHLMKWIDEHKAHFAGPVANKEVFPATRSSSSSRATSSCA